MLHIEAIRTCAEDWWPEPALNQSKLWFWTRSYQSKSSIFWSISSRQGCKILKRYWSFNLASITTASFRQDLLQMETELMSFNTLDDQRKSIAYINKLSVQIVYDLQRLFTRIQKAASIFHHLSKLLFCVNYHSCDKHFLYEKQQHTSCIIVLKQCSLRLTRLWLYSRRL